VWYPERGEVDKEAKLDKKGRVWQGRDHKCSRGLQVFSLPTSKLSEAASFGGIRKDV